MKKEELFNDDFLKQFKTGDELNGFLKELQKRGIEKMLEGELDGHLDYQKHQRPFQKAGAHLLRRVGNTGAEGPGRLLQPHDRTQTGQHGRRHRERDRIALRQGNEQQ